MLSQETLMLTILTMAICKRQILKKGIVELRIKQRMREIRDFKARWIYGQNKCFQRNEKNRLLSSSNRINFIIPMWEMTTCQSLTQFEYIWVQRREIYNKSFHFDDLISANVLLNEWRAPEWSGIVFFQVVG